MYTTPYTAVDHQFGTLDSDQLLLQVAAAAVARQAQQQSAEEEEGEGDGEERGQVNPAVLGLQVQCINTYVIYTVYIHVGTTFFICMSYTLCGRCVMYMYAYQVETLC